MISSVRVDLLSFSDLATDSVESDMVLEDVTEL